MLLSPSQTIPTSECTRSLSDEASTWLEKVLNEYPAAAVIQTLAKYARHSRKATLPEDLEILLAVSIALANRK